MLESIKLNFSLFVKKEFTLLYIFDGEGFKSRILEVMALYKNEAVFANAVGLSLPTVRKYKDGSMPGLDKACMISKASGVNLLWLATGEGPKTGAPQAAYDTTLLSQCLEMVQTELDIQDKEFVSADAHSGAVSALYEYYVSQKASNPDVTSDNVVPFARQLIKMAG